MSETIASADVASVAAAPDDTPDPSPGPDPAVQRAAALDYHRRELALADDAIARATAKVAKMQALVEDAERSVVKVQADRDAIAAELDAAEQEEV